MTSLITLVAASILFYKAGRAALTALLTPKPAPAVVVPVPRPPDEGRPKLFDFPLFKHYRGGKVTTQAEVMRYFAASPGPLFELAGVLWPCRRFLNKLTFITGRPDSGKTVLMRMMMESVAGLFHLIEDQARAGLYPGPGLLRWFVIDPTNAFLRLLYQVVPGDVPIVRATPIDRDGLRWDIAADITSDALNEALQVGLFPDALTQKANDPFWTTKAKEVSAGVVTVFLDRKSAWQFHDLVIPIKYPQYLKPLLEQSERTRGLAGHDLVGRLGRDITASASATINKMAIAAALWQRAEGTFSLKRFLEERQVLHFAYTPDLIPSFAGIANAMSHVLILLGIARNDPHNHTLFWFDEARYLSDLGGLEDLAARGRGAGFGAICAAQGEPGLKNKWGNGRVSELLDLIATWVTLSAGPETAEAFSKAVGKMEGLQKSYGYSYTNSHTETRSTNTGGSSSYSSKGGTTTGSNWGSSYSSSRSSSETYSENFQLVTKEAVMAGEITNLPYADNVDDRIAGFAFNPEVGAFRFEAPFLHHFRNLPECDVDAMPRRADSDQVLRPWTMEDIERLGLDPTPDLVAAVKTTWNGMGGAA
jgi:hypothetical protein